MRVLRVLGLLGVLSGVALVTDAGPAVACSCVDVPAEQVIFEMPYVFVGTPISFEALEQEGEMQTFPHPNRVVRFSVDEVLVGDVGPEIDVLVDQFGDCGVPTWGEGLKPKSGEVVVLASDYEGEPMAGGCLPEPSPGELAAILESALPEATSTGPVAFVMPFREKWASVVALDALGEVVAWGAGDLTPRQIVGCDDGAYVVETRESEIRVRNLATMEIEQAFSDGAGDERRLECLSAADGVVEILTVGFQFQSDETRTIRHFLGGDLIGEYRSDEPRFAVVDRVNSQVFMLSPLGGVVSVVEIETMRAQTLDGLTMSPTLGGTISPDGTQMAVVIPVTVPGEIVARLAEVEIYSVEPAGLVLTNRFDVDIENLLIDGLPGKFLQVLWSESGVIVLEVSAGYDMWLVRVMADGTQLDTLTVSGGLSSATLGSNYVALTYDSVDFVDLLSGETTPLFAGTGVRPIIPAIVSAPPSVIAPVPSAPELRQITAAERDAAQPNQPNQLEQELQVDEPPSTSDPGSLTSAQTRTGPTRDPGALPIVFLAAAGVILLALAVGLRRTRTS
jgi:hypothetical protein